MIRGFRPKRQPGRLQDIGLTLGFLFLLILLAAQLAGTADEAVLAGNFRIVDGDTLAQGSERLRLSGIDAPELSQTCRRDNGDEWACGQAARAALADLMRAGAPQCRGSARDRYRRLLVTCATDGETINGRMVRSGFAIATGLVSFRQQQTLARSDRAGIWNGSFETPKDWRARSKTTEDDREMRESWQTIKAFLALDWL